MGVQGKSGPEQGVPTLPQAYHLYRQAHLKHPVFAKDHKHLEPKSAPSAVKISKHRHLSICSSKNSTGFPWHLEWQGGQLQNSNSRVGRSGHEQVVGVYVEREVRAGRTKQYLANSTMWLPTVTTAYNKHPE